MSDKPINLLGEEAEIATGLVRTCLHCYWTFHPYAFGICETETDCPKCGSNAGVTKIYDRR